MKTKEKETRQEGKSLTASNGGSQAIPEGATSRVVFFGPAFSAWEDRVIKLQTEENEKHDLGDRVDREEIKAMAVAYVDRVVDFSKLEPESKLDPKKEPMVLLIEKWEIEELIRDPRCKMLKAMLAVEVNSANNPKHQTFVLMPCDEYGHVVMSGTNAGRERWNFGRNVNSILSSGGPEVGVENFLSGELEI